MITKIINLYFIQIRHNDDLPSTGTRLLLVVIHNNDYSLLLLYKPRS